MIVLFFLGLIAAIVYDIKRDADGGPILIYLAVYFALLALYLVLVEPIIGG